MIAIDTGTGGLVSAEVDVNRDGEVMPIRFQGEWYYPSRWRTTDGRVVYKTDAAMLDDAERRS